MLKVVIDTNVFISSFFDGVPREIIEYWKSGKLTLCLSQETTEGSAGSALSWAKRAFSDSLLTTPVGNRYPPAGGTGNEHGRRQRQYLPLYRRTGPDPQLCDWRQTPSDALPGSSTRPVR